MIWWPGQIDCLPGPNVVDQQVRPSAARRRAAMRFAGRLVVRDGGFVEVAEVVQLVAVDRSR